MPDYRQPDSFKIVPRHVAIIMDGNGRWAKRRSWERIRGHNRGVETVREIAEAASHLKLEQLTLYALSTENWLVRPKREVKFLMSLLKSFIVNERPTMMKNNIRLTTIGHIEEFSEDIKDVIEETRQMTEHNSGTKLCLALNYGARQEIIDAVSTLAGQVKSGALNPEDITEEKFAQCLYQPDMPEPDLLIRTAGELRISNFLLWQISYSEIWVTEKLWPEFVPEDFYQAIEDFARRERRYGGLNNLNQVPH